MDQFQHI